MDLAHGVWKIYRHNNVMVTHTAGAWNRPAMEAFCEEYKQQVSGLLDRPWASLLLIERWELGTLDIEPLLKDLLDWLTNHNLHREAAVLEGGAARKEQMRRNIPGNKPGYQRQNFETLEQACNWLVQEGFDVCRQDISREYQRWCLTL